jgi:beta-lactamase class C
MKIKHYILIGLLIIALPLLIAQMMLSKGTPPTAVVKKKGAEFEVSFKPTENPSFRKLLQDYESQVNQLQATSHTPGAAIAIIQDSTIIFMKGFGVKEAGKKDTIDANTVFRIASVSKCFASFLTGILVEDHMLAWNDKVIKYVPDFALKNPAQTSALTIEHVLSHTTGLPMHAYTNLVEEGLPLKKMLEELKDVNLIGKPGEIYSYQNVAYSLIGEVMHAGTRKSYESLMIEKVFKPLNMKHASIDYFSMITNPNIARPHSPGKGGWRRAKITNTYYNVAPAGGINASISDMAKWMVALLGNRPNVISKETLHKLFTPHVEARSKNRNYGRLRKIKDSYYGLGWRILYFPEDTLVYHGGYVNGYRSEVAVNEKDRIAICILANAPGELADNGIPLFFNLYLKQREAILAWEEQHKKIVQDSVSLY